MMYQDYKDADTMNLTASLAGQLSRFCSAPRNQKAMTIVVNDWEYLYDIVRHDHYRHSEGEGAERKVRWPSHRIAAGAWAIIDFPANGALPIVRSIEVLDSRVGNEVEIVERFFAALSAHPNAVPVSWGGEFKDLQVLRMVASVNGLQLPPVLRILSPFTPLRLDLNVATATKGHLVHLPEYATACGIPTKAVSSKVIGPAALAADWPTVAPAHYEAPSAPLHPIEYVAGSPRSRLRRLHPILVEGQREYPRCPENGGFLWFA